MPFLEFCDMDVTSAARMPIGNWKYWNIRHFCLLVEFHSVFVTSIGRTVKIDTKVRRKREFERGVKCIESLDGAFL